MSTRALIGRERELGQLLEGLDALAAGRGSLFLLVGEPGIGKTRLADELGRRAETRGATVAWGAAWDGGGAPAYWPWIQVLRALRPLVPAPDEHLRRDLGPLWNDDAAEVVEPAGGPAAAPHDPELVRFRRYDALRAVLHAAARHAPLVVILEDLHAADRASLLALQLVARALRSLPVLLLATHRPAESLVPDLGDLLARLGREGATLPLARLDRGQVVDMLADILANFDPLPPAQLDEIFEASGGNPLFVDESVRLVRTGSRIHDVDVPAGVSALIRERLGHFEPGARAALETAAVLGREVSLPLLADACGLSPAELQDHLRQPRASGLLEAAEAPQHVRFAHGLYRERLVEDLGPERLAGLHLGAAEALLRRRAAGHLEAEEPLARHLLAAGPRSDPTLTVAWAARAAEGACRALAFDRAVTLYEGALAALSRIDAAGPRRLDLSLDLAEALARAGAGQRSRALCLTVAGEARAAGDAVRLARAALAYGAELRLAVVDQTLVGLLGEALAALGDAADNLRARVMARLAAAQQPAPDPRPPVQLARDAIALARQGGDSETLLVTLHSAGAALVDYAAPEERLPLDRELVALALPRGELTVAQRGYARLALDCFELGELGEAALATAAHERLGQALGHPRWRWRGPLLRAMAANLAGRWDEADRAEAEARTFVFTAGSSAEDSEGAATLAIYRLGALRAREVVERHDLAALEATALTDRAYLAGVLVPLRASVLARLGDAEGARRCLESLAGSFGPMTSDPMALALLSDAAALLGDRARAAQLLPALAALAAREGGSASDSASWGVFGLTWEGPLGQWTGALAATLGRYDEAVPSLEEALAAAQALGARPLQARLAQDLAAALRGRNQPGDRARAQALAESARDTATALGMKHLCARLDRASFEPAPTPVPAPTPAPVSSSPSSPSLVREGEVWTITFAGQQTRLKHSRALEILAQLLENPGRDLHVLALGGGGDGDGEVVDAGDAGELLDEDARRAYRARISELGRELDEASAWADGARRDRLRAELEFLEDELARGVGLGGRPRRAGAAVERARSNVQKRLRGLIRRLDATLPALAQHLDREIRTGIQVSYRRQPPGP